MHSKFISAAAPAKACHRHHIVLLPGRFVRVPTPGFAPSFPWPKILPVLADCTPQRGSHQPRSIMIVSVQRHSVNQISEIACAGRRIWILQMLHAGNVLLLGTKSPRPSQSFVNLKREVDVV